MPDSIQPLDVPEDAEDADVLAARALADLVEVVRTEPVLRPLAMSRPVYYLHASRIFVAFHNVSAGQEVLAAAAAFFVGAVTAEYAAAGASEEYHVLASVWQHVPLRIRVPIRREDELAALRKQLEELQAAERYRRAQLDEQEHLVADVAPVPSAYIAPAGVSR